AGEGHKEPDGHCHPVGGLADKVAEVATQRGSANVFLAARTQPEDLEEGSRQWGLRIERAESLREAADTVAGLPGAGLAYLEALAADVKTLPRYYPPDALMERVRVRVRVSTERTRFDPHEAAERERQRREGVIGDDEGMRAYNRPVRGEGDEKE